MKKNQRHFNVFQIIFFHSHFHEFVSRKKKPFSQHQFLKIVLDFFFLTKKKSVCLNSLKISTISRKQTIFFQFLKINIFRFFFFFKLKKRISNTKRGKKIIPKIIFKMIRDFFSFLSLKN